MIKYQLKCECGHEFESWFSNSLEFDRLQKNKLLSCVCGTSNKITKQLMSPRVASSKANKENFKDDFYTNVQKKLTELRNYVENNAEYVGDRLVSEARSIHYDKKKSRSIYGNATSEQAKELAEEGIQVGLVPWISKTDS